MNINTSLSAKLVAGLILAASLSSCNLAEELKAAQVAGESLHATGTNVEDKTSTSSDRVVHLTYTGVQHNGATDDQSQASMVAVIFFVNMKKTAFDGIEVTLEKIISEEKGVVSSSTSTGHSYMFSGADVKRASELYETAVKPFNRSMDNIEKLKALSETSYLSDSALHVLQQAIADIESIHGKGVTTHFRGFVNTIDSSGKHAMVIKCDNLNAKNEPISFCRFVFFDGSGKVAGERIWDYTSALSTDKSQQVEEEK